jgi:GWxTD domain-containing protein
MAVPDRHRLTLLTLLLAAAPSAGLPESPVVDTRRFPRLVRLLLLPEEESVLKKLKDERDRREFQQIFWARRDPSPGTATNEFEDTVRVVWARADELFALPGQRGSETGCGQVLALLGRPHEMKGLELRMEYDVRDARDGARRPEEWTFRSPTAAGDTFTGAELHVSFDAECRFAEGGIVLQDLRRAAAARITRPDIGYPRGPDGHLVPLAAQVGGGAGALDLLATPRSDFPLQAETKLVMRGPKGDAVVAGLIRFPAPPPGGAALRRVFLAVRAADASGQTAVSTAWESLVAPLPDGSAVASWGVSLKTGRYQVTIAGLLPDTRRGGVSMLDVDVPDFGGASLIASPLIAYPDDAAPPTTALPGDAGDPFAYFLVGAQRLQPRFGNVFATTDAIRVVATIHGARVDVATGQASLRARFTILNKGKPVARGPEDVFTTPDAVASVGPIPLADYGPGHYVVRLDVTDGVARQTLRQEASFEIRADGGTR